MTAKLVEDEKIVMGKVIKVENQMKVATANDVYCSPKKNSTRSQPSKPTS